MRSYRGLRTQVFIAAIFVLFVSAASVAGQTTRFPGPAARERNRSMDDYDRELNRLKNDAKAKEEAKRTMERRRDRFPQINEDFQKMQEIHNEIVRMVQPGKELDYDRLSELAADMKKRGGRLQTNLALSEPPEEVPEPQDLDVRKSIFALHDLLVSFVGSPLFKNLGVIDAKAVEKASGDLQGILTLSDNLKQKAELEKRTAKHD